MIRNNESYSFFNYVCEVIIKNKVTYEIVRRAN